MFVVFLLCPSLMIYTYIKKASIGKEGHKGKNHKHNLDDL
jgi:hypothetical protein